jgi:hypothetical protein
MPDSVLYWIGLEPSAIQPFTNSPYKALQGIPLKQSLQKSQQ